MNDKQKQLIEKTRQKVGDLQQQQDKLYENMVRELGITDDPTGRGDFLWDYVFNCADDTCEAYMTMVRENIFGKNDQAQQRDSV